MKICNFPRATLLYLALQASYAFASPEGATVISGDIQIAGQGSSQVEIVQTTNQGIINWDSFNVAVGETVNFVTPGYYAATLNRITGGNASEILGNLKSNGQVWLINPNGILFGKNAQINVASLTASTLNITDQNFLGHRHVLQQEGSHLTKIVNQGHISAEEGGHVVLLAPQIENNGVIEAYLGTVALGVGTSATLQLDRNDLLSFTVSQGAHVPLYDEEGHIIAALSHTGSIQADGGKVLMTAASIDAVLDQSINMTGMIKADTVQDRPGKIVLLASGNTILDSATLSAQGLNDGEQGGAIKVMGKNVALAGYSTLSVDGSGGGGDIRIGKDLRDSRGSEATMTFIDQNASLTASALVEGDGGFIETSGHYLQTHGAHITAKGAHGGKSGTWLLDPYNVTISNGTPSGTSFSGGTFTPAATSVIGASDLSTALSTSGQHIRIQTGSSGSQAGNIVVSNAITWSTDSTLYLDAAGSIQIAAAINGGSSGYVTLVAAGGAITDSSGSGSIQSAGATIQAGNGSTTYYDISLLNTNNDFGNQKVDLWGHNITLTESDSTANMNTGYPNSGIASPNGGLLLGSVTASGNIVLTEQTHDLYLGYVSGSISFVGTGQSLTLNAPHGSIDVGGEVNAGSQTVNLTAGDPSVAGSGKIGDTSTGTFTAQTTHLNANGPRGNYWEESGIVFNNGGGYFGTLTATAVDDQVQINDNNPSGIVLGDISGTSISINALGTITVTGTLSNQTLGIAPSVSLTSNLGDIVEAQGGSIDAIAGLIAMAENLNADPSGCSFVSGLYIGCTGRGAITLNGANNFHGAGVSLAGTAVSLNDTYSGGLNLGRIDASDNINITTSHNLTLNNLVQTSKSGGEIHLTAGSTATLFQGANITGGGSNAIALSLSGGTISQSGSALINTHGGSLALSGGATGDIALNTGYLSANQIGTITGSNLGGAVSLYDNGSSLAVGNMTFSGAGSLTLIAEASGAAITQTAATTISTHNGSVTLQSLNGNINQNGAITTLGGDVTLSLRSDLGTISQHGTGSIDTVRTGITTSYGLVRAQSSHSGAWTVNLNNASNHFQSLAIESLGSSAAQANLTVNNSTNLALGLFYTYYAHSNADSLSGLTVNTSSGNGAVTQLTTVSGGTAEALKITGASTINVGSGDITLTQANNNFGHQVVTLTGGNIALTDANTTGLILGNASAASHITATASGTMTLNGDLTTAEAGTITLTSGTLGCIDGVITDNDGAGSIHTNGGATTLSALNAGDNGNSITLLGDHEFGALNVTAVSNMTVNDINTSGLTLSGITGNGSGGDITVVSAGTLTLADSTAVTSSGSVTLVANQLNNLAGSSAVTVGNEDRWLIYLSHLNGNTFGSLSSGNQAIFGTDYPTGIAQLGHRYIFGGALPILNLRPLSPAFSLSKESGSLAVLPTPVVGTNYQIVGFVNAAEYENVFTQDTVNNVSINGNLSFASLGSTTAASSGVYAVTLSGTGSTSSYEVAYTPTEAFGHLTIAAQANNNTANAPSVVSNWVNQSSNNTPAMNSKTSSDSKKAIAAASEVGESDQKTGGESESCTTNADGKITCAITT